MHVAIVQEALTEVGLRQWRQATRRKGLPMHSADI